MNERTQSADRSGPSFTDGPGSALYLFCFGRSGCLDQPIAPDMEGYSPLREVRAGGLAAVVCEVRREDFQDESRTQDLKWLAPRAQLHDALIRRVFARSSVLPVKFGTLFSSADALVRQMERITPTVADFLDRSEGQEEWAVKAFVEENAGLDWAVQADPDLRRQRERIAELPPGTRYLRERKLQMDLQKQAGAWYDRLAGRLRERLASLGLPSRPLRLYQAGVMGHPGRMVLHEAYLVPRPRVDELRRLVEALPAACALPRLEVETSGPWPPYNFCPELGLDSQMP